MNKAERYIESANKWMINEDNELDVNTKQALSNPKSDSEKIGAIINEIDDVNDAATSIYDTLYSQIIRNNVINIIGGIINSVDDLAMASNDIAVIMAGMIDNINNTK